jgi:hypothetical protein
MSRDHVVKKIVATKVSKALKWSDVAVKIGLSKEWTTAACLGQMTLNAEQATVLGEIFDLTEEERKWLTCAVQRVPAHHRSDRPEGRSREYRHVREVPSVQDILTSQLRSGLAIKFALDTMARSLRQAADLARLSGWPKHCAAFRPNGQSKALPMNQHLI